MPNTLKDITERRAALTAEREKRKSDHGVWLQSCDNELRALALREHMHCKGIDLDRLDRGHAVIAVRGRLSTVVHGFDSDQDRSGIRQSAVAAARNDLAGGAQKLRKVYFGVKNYDRFGDQREDHQYGYGPKHGSIVFSIGLQRERAERLNDGDELTPDEIEDALYVLATLDIAERAETEAA